MSYPKWFYDYFFPTWRLWHSKNWSVKINDRYNELLLLKENILNIQSVLPFLHAIATSKTQSFSIFYWIPIKVVEKWAVRIKLINILLAVCKRILKYHTFMIVSLVSSVCIGIFKTCSFIQRMIYDKRKCCLKIHNFVCPKGWILMGKSLVGIPPVRTAFGIKIVNSYKLSFPTHSRNAVNYISHSFYSLKLTAGLIKMYIFLPLNFLPTLIYAD